MSKEDLSLSLCLPTAGSVHYKIVVDCAKKGISYTFIDYDQKKWIMLYISRIVFPCFLALVCITCVWVCVSAWAKERVRDRVKRDFSKRGARGQEAVNFRLTFAPYVRHTYVTSTSVCVCVSDCVSMCGSQKNGGQDYLLDFRVTLFSKLSQSPITIASSFFVLTNTKAE